MKRSKLVPIGVCLVVFCLIIGIVILPEFMIDKVKFPASIVHWSGFQKVRKLVPQPDPNQFLLVEHHLTDSAYHEVKPLDESQIKKMVNQLIPEDLASKNDQGKVILSSPNKKVMKDFQEHLNKELSKGWTISRSTSNIDAMVTGDLFTLTIPRNTDKDWNGGVLPLDQLLEESKDQNDLTEARGVGSKSKQNNEKPRSIKRVTKIYGVWESKQNNEKPRRALFLYWVVETNRSAKEVLSATTNYGNSQITAATKDLTKNLIAKNLIKIEKHLKVAVINTSGNLPASDLVTASILEKMVNEKTGVTFLHKTDTSEHDTELKKALKSDNNQKVSREYLAKKFSKSTGASAALIISQPSRGHFYLELIELPSLNLLAIGRSEDQQGEQLQ